MTQHFSLEVEEMDVPLVINFAKRLGIKISRNADLNFENDDEKMKWAMNYFSDNPSFDNVLEWQKNERKERKLPFRDE